MAAGLCNVQPQVLLLNVRIVIQIRPLSSQRYCNTSGSATRLALGSAGFTRSSRSNSFLVFAVTDLWLQPLPLEDVRHLATHGAAQTTLIDARPGHTVTRNIVERIVA